jgi:type I restriction enzyme R subunit
MNTPKTKEQYSTHIPAIKTLMAMGWQYLSAGSCLQKRGNQRDVLLKDELIRFLQKHRFDFKGQSYPLSPNAIEQIVRELSAPALNEGLLTANEKIYNQLCLGITVTEFINGQKYQPTVAIVDWHNIANNILQVTEELEVTSAQGTHSRRPDIVLYVNGIPLVVVEAKRPDSGNLNKNIIDEGVSQQIRNQKNDEIPVLFAYAQLLLSISGTEGRYGTTKTLKKFWTKWREEEFTEAYFNQIKNTKLNKANVNALFADKDNYTKHYFESLWQQDELPTEQDRLLISLLSPQRLLDFIRFFVLFDKKVGKIVARYQQAFGIWALLKRVEQRKPDGAREGGVIWHTTGSGKSFTMVYLCKALLMEQSLKNCRMVVVTDRVDLEKQLANTFLSGGAFGSDVANKKEGEQAKVRTGKDLAHRIGKGNERIIFTIINKFAIAARQAECYNPSSDLIVLIDEAHRSQGGENHERMKQALPNAAYIAFTGTPLLKEDKTTNKFGKIIHAYTMQRAVDDKTVTPLLYEERQPELDINKQAIDNWFAKITAGLSEEQKTDLKKKFASKGVIYGSDNRIELIAWDIAVHFSENIKKLRLGLKGQVATDSKLSAIRYKKHLDSTGLVSSAVVISPPDTREGHQDVDEKVVADEVQQWWKDNVGHDAESYERKVIENFATEGDPDLLIVVDKLLTGFDEPRNAVLYIDKQFNQEHNLLQAIARVNRLHESKQFGLLIDYRGILEKLDTSVKKYQDLANRTQGGFDIDDLEGLYSQVSTEYKKLPMLHDKLWKIFASVKNKHDLEQYRQILVPKYEENPEGESHDVRLKVREDFYEALTDFGMCLKLSLSSSSFFEDKSFSEKLIQTYKDDLRFFTDLRKVTRQDAQETVDYSAYEEQIRRLVDKQVVGNQIREPKGVYIVGELAKGSKPEDWSEEKTRNETDLIRTRVRKTIEQALANDPYAKKYFSELLKQAIEEAEALFDHPIKQYALFKAFEEKVQNRDIGGMPEALKDNTHAKAYYGVILLVLGDEAFKKLPDDQKQTYINECLEIDRIVDTAVSEYSLNPQGVEKAINRELLPRLYKLMGMDKAREVIDAVIQITRVGISRGDH